MKIAYTIKGEVIKLEDDAKLPKGAFDTPGKAGGFIDRSGRFVLKAKDGDNKQNG